MAVMSILSVCVIIGCSDSKSTTDNPIEPITSITTTISTTSTTTTTITTTITASTTTTTTDPNTRKPYDINKDRTYDATARYDLNVYNSGEVVSTIKSGEKFRISSLQIDSEGYFWYVLHNGTGIVHEDGVDSPYQQYCDLLRNLYGSDERIHHNTYHQYDINNDGTNEWFIQLGTCMAEYRYAIYTVMEGDSNISKVGEIPDGSLYIDDTGNVIVADGYMGNETVSQVYFDGKTVYSEILYERGNLEEYSTPGDLLEINQLSDAFGESYINPYSIISEPEYIEPENPEPAVTSFSDDELRTIATKLGVPADLNIWCEQSTPYEDTSIGMWLIAVTIYNDNTAVAYAAVDTASLDPMKSIMSYTPLIVEETTDPYAPPPDEYWETPNVHCPYCGYEWFTSSVGIEGFWCAECGGNFMP